MYNVKEEQDKLLAQGKRLCVDCKHGGFYTIHINFLSCEHPDRFCKFEAKENA